MPAIVAFLACFWLQGVPEVAVRAGDLYYTASGREERVTVDGRNSQPSLSVDGLTILYLKIPVKSAGKADAEAWPEIWRAKKVNGAFREERLFTGPLRRRNAVFGALSRPLFGPDGDAVYFLVDDYSSTAAGLFRLDLAQRTPALVTSAQSYYVVDGGDDRGHLVVEQCRMMRAGGRYCMFYLFDPSGKELDVVGVTDRDARTFLFGSSENVR